MKSYENPYSLNFGVIPSQYVPRAQQMEQIIGTFNSKKPSIYVYLISGIRGSGKTVLMSNVSEELKKDPSWIVISLNPTRDILHSAVEKLNAHKEFSKIKLTGKVDFSLLGIGVSIEGAEKISDEEVALETILTYVKKIKKKVLFTIDEVTNSEYIKQFTSTFQNLVREEYPIFLQMTGLYENIRKIQDEDELTFLYRAPRIELTPLNIGGMMESYKNTLGVDEETARKMAKKTNGYSYAFQLLGYLSYQKKEGFDINVEQAYRQYLEEYSYEKIWHELSAIEKNILIVLAKSNTKKVKDIREKIQSKSNNFSVYRTRLIRKGVVYSPSYGELDFTLPEFDKFTLDQE